MYRMGKREVDEVRRVIESGQLFRVGNAKAGHLGEVDRFEREWARTIGVKHALCVTGGGTAALICGLVGLGIGPGDEVIVPGYTFMASASAVLAVGAIPVIAEIDESIAIAPEDVEQKITRRTKAVIPVHMVGIPCHMRRIMRVARRHGVKVLEDACQADGGSFGGQRLGSWGDAGAFSFNFYKIISCGEGGALVTDDRLVYERAAIYHDSGVAFRPHAKDYSIPVFLGLQFRANEIMGALMRVQLTRLAGILADLRRIRRRFVAELTGAKGVRFAPSNDPRGDCGVVVAFQFPTEAQARGFAKSDGVGGWLPIDTGKHIYSNWEPILKHRVGSHPALNPYRLPQNHGLRMRYTKDMCPRTLDILKRTVFVSLHPDMKAADVARRIRACRTAAAATA
jgi:dTDP-4-amino-4,6-dideoxygalactose transaminase